MAVSFVSNEHPIFSRISEEVAASFQLRSEPNRVAACASGSVAPCNRSARLHVPRNSLCTQAARRVECNAEKRRQAYLNCCVFEPPNDVGLFPQKRVVVRIAPQFAD